MSATSARKTGRGVDVAGAGALGDDVGVLTPSGNSLTARERGRADGAAGAAVTAGGALPPQASAKKSALHAQKVRARAESASKMPS